MNLVIDIGNTLVKLAVFEAGEIGEVSRTQKPDKDQIQKLLGKYPKIKSSIISSVGDETPELEKFLSNQFPVLVLGPETKLPFENQYSTPKTLGKDRIAAVAGALTIFPGDNVLVIDAGTCITFDLLTADRKYLGGAISPGIEMRLKALHHFTSRLPSIEANYASDIELIGDSTVNSILSGAQNGVIQEVDGIINTYKKRFPGLKVIVCGGDNNYFDKYLKNNIFAAPNLVLIGLMKILQFNENN